MHSLEVLVYSFKVMSAQKVVLALFSYVRPIEDSLHTIWTPAQYEELQLQVYKVLNDIQFISLGKGIAI